MFNIKPDDRMTLTERLLYNIYELLKEGRPLQQDKPKEEVKEEKPKPLYENCKYCGGTHYSFGEYGNCAKRHKKNKKE